jgi:hypothetical protein
MKKNLVAVAACTAASWACAPSSITRFGVITSPNHGSSGTEFGIRHSF